MVLKREEQNLIIGRLKCDARSDAKNFEIDRECKEVMKRTMPGVIRPKRIVKQPSFFDAKAQARKSAVERNEAGKTETKEKVENLGSEEVSWVGGGGANNSLRSQKKEVKGERPTIG